MPLIAGLRRLEASCLLGGVRLVAWYLVFHFRSAIFWHLPDWAHLRVAAASSLLIRAVGERPGRIQHTWVSPSTLGKESTVTVTFQEHGDDTLMSLVHSGLPDDDKARSHERGWNYFLGIFSEQFGKAHVRKAAER